MGNDVHAAGTTATQPAVASPGDVDADVLVVGAGMAGLYLLHRLRGAGFSAIAIDAADGVGGTWYWNRYPGARCDIPSLDYQYTFDPDLAAEWEWSEKYATQPEILRYLEHVADRYDLRRDIRFGTRLGRADWDDAGSRWVVRVEPAGEPGDRAGDADRAGEAGDRLTCRHVVMATGCLSVPKDPDIPGTERFGGDVYVTGRWPHDQVDFSGKRVAVIGTGSSGIQSIPLIAAEADRVTVFQRTPNFSMPAFNGPIPDALREAVEADPAGYREACRYSRAGVVMPDPVDRVYDVSDDERRARFDDVWSRGLLLAPSSEFSDLVTDQRANGAWAGFIHDKIRAVVDDPAIADLLCPTDHPYGTKRPCLDTGYYATYNLPNVRLVDLRSTPIASITETGVQLDACEGTDGGAGESIEFDAIVYATGFDAMTGALVSVDFHGRDGITLADRWSGGPLTYLGLMSVGFPNMFMITGPGSPSVLSNMVISIEQHVDLVVDLIAEVRDRGHACIEPTPAAEAGWVQHVNDCADITLFPKANSWYTGANVPGKPRVFLPYVGGVDTYRRTCEQVVDRDLLGFRTVGPGGERVVDGVVNRLQPDVMFMLRLMAELDPPKYESLSPGEARAFSEAAAEMRRPGPEVGEIVDGTLPGPAGDLAYRLYHPSTVGDVAGLPVVCYFHGGGWVLGSAISDDPFCREMCELSGALVISIDYRHAPEHRFPAAADDALAGVRWVAEHADAFGGDPDRVMVAGWSAGAGLAAVVAQRVRDEGGPALRGQLLVAPVADGSRSYPSMDDNADGYVLTESLMSWFWDHYADPADRTSPLASPLLADDLSGLPPAAIFTAEFDPLRDEGIAYADALAAAGVDATHHPGRGQIHISLTAADMIISSEPLRAGMAAAIRSFLA